MRHLVRRRRGGELDEGVPGCGGEVGEGFVFDGGVYGGPKAAADAPGGGVPLAGGAEDIVQRQLGRLLTCELVGPVDTLGNVQRGSV